MSVPHTASRPSGAGDAPPRTVLGAAAALAAVGAVVLGVRATLTLGPDRFGTLEPAAAAVPALGALLAAAAVVLVRRGGVAVPLLGTALLAALVSELLPVAPPRLLGLVPLAAALALRAAPGRPAGPDASGWPAAVGWSGIALHLLVGYPYAVSGLVAPLSGIGVLWAAWTALLVLAVRLRPRRPLLVPLVPVAAFGLWLAVLSVGDRLLGWTA